MKNSEQEESDALFQPSDAANKRLRDHVAPSGWKNPKPSGRYNLVVVGAGTGGLVTAAATAVLGGRVALVEREALGGDCLNVGCVPSKAVLAAAKRAAQVRRADDFGVTLPGEAKVDFAAVMQRMREKRAQISPNDSARRFAEMGVDVYLGNGEFKDGSTLVVEGIELSFAKAVVATGARAGVPPIPGLKEADPLTNETVFSLTELPRRLAVIGAGPIGCELAQAFARLGSQVTVLEMAERILANDEEEAAEVVQAALSQDGVDFVLGASIEKVESGDEESVIRYKQDGKEERLACDRILLGAGRLPNVKGMGLEAAGVKYDERKGIEVDERLRTSNPRIYAVGDVCMEYKFTHAADAAARLVVQNALFLGRKKHTELNIPWCTYTEPELAHVGLSEKEAREKHGDKIRVFRQDFADVDRSIVEGSEEGFVKVVALKGKILGATIVGSGAGDLISEITLAMEGDVSLGTIGSAIHPYPTSAEAIRKIGDSYSRERLTPGIKKLFRKWLAWSR